MVDWPWSRPAPPAPALKDNRPRLNGIEVEPVMYRGSPIKWKVVAVFDRGKITLGTFDMERRARIMAAELMQSLDTTKTS